MLEKIYIGVAGDNTCIACGQYIPEETQVCEMCSQKAKNNVPDKQIIA